MKLYYHPFASFCWKALIAFYEKGVAFEPVELEGPGSASQQALERLWPIGKFPVLVDGALVLPESTIMIEHLDRVAPAPRLIPDELDAALQVRLWDRIFDHYVQAPMQTMVSDLLRPVGAHDPHGVEAARAMLGTAYAMIEGHMAARTWAAGEAFTMADCAATPALFYAECVVPFRAEFPALRRYFERLMARPSVARVVDEARPYRGVFPGTIPGDL